LPDSFGLLHGTG